MILANHTLRAYDERLNGLLELIFEMGTLVRSMVLDAKRSLRTRDVALAANADKADSRINELDAHIEEAATVILALQNPMAIDLRFVTSAIKIGGLLERAADLAKNVIKRSVQLGDYRPETVLVRLDAMADHVVYMLDDALEAVRTQDEARATAVWKHDDVVDEHYHRIFEVMQEEITRNPANVQYCTHIVFAAKNFERAADYVTNLAKTVYYVTSGTRPGKNFLEGQA